MRTSLLCPLCLLAITAAASPAPAPLLVLHGEGEQVYRCTTTGWVLDHPEAKLTDASGAQVGTHSAGPSWQYKDGSVVRGQAVEKTPSPDPASVPWLVVRATTHQGAGMFAQVETIRRTDTHGGVAPTAGCDAEHLAAQTHIPYSATYSFFAK